MSYNRQRYLENVPQIELTDSHKLPLQKDVYVQIINNAIEQIVYAWNRDCLARYDYFPIPRSKDLKQFYLNVVGENPLEIELAFMKRLVIDHNIAGLFFEDESNDDWDSIAVYKKYGYL